jgi:hypothetical protein
MQPEQLNQSMNQWNQVRLAVDTVTQDLNLATASSVTLPHQVADISNACLRPETAVPRANRHAQVQKHPTNIFHAYDLMLQCDKYSDKEYK